MADPLWQAARTILRYPRPLVVAAGGALFQMLCFGASISMMVPIFYILLRDQRTLPELASRFAEQEPWLAPVIQSVTPWLPTEPFAGFVWVMLIGLTMTILASGARFVHEYASDALILRAMQHWRAKLFGRLLATPYETVLIHGSHDHIGRLVLDVQIVANGLRMLLGKALSSLVKGAAAVIIALVLDWRLTLLGLIGAPLLVGLLRVLGRKITKATKRSLQAQSALIGAASEAVQGGAVVKTHQAEGVERRRFGRINRRLLRHQVKRVVARLASSTANESVAVLCLSFAGIVSAWYVLNRGLDPEQFLAVLSMLAIAGVTARPLAGLHAQLREASAAASRLVDIEKLPEEESLEDLRSRPRLAPHRRDLRFEGLHYRYPGQVDEALRGVDLVVPFGSRIAIVGGNGSGKSTLVNTLPRLLTPTEGRVFIDGQDLAEVSVRSLRRQIAMVTQQSVLFAGTVRDNIAYGRPEASPKEIEAAARLARADVFIRTLPEGYDHPLGEGGAGLSGGQRQRLCIARAVLRNPAILILDEATSQVDAESEVLIAEALRSIAQGRTTLVIAHRLSTVADADMIVVMDRGRIVATGRHDDLLADCEVYRALAESQLQDDRPVATAQAAS